MRKLVLLLVHALTGSILIVSGIIGSGSIVSKVLLGIIGVLFMMGLGGHIKEIGIGGNSK